MAKTKHKTVYVLELSKDFYVEAETSEDSYDFWLCRKDFGIKTYCYGEPLFMYNGIGEALNRNKSTLLDREYMDVFFHDLLEGEEVDENFNIVE